MKTVTMTILAMSALLAAPAFADSNHHPVRGADAVGKPASAMFERMQDNLKIMQAQLQRAAGARTDQERAQAMEEHMLTMRENIGMAQNLRGGTADCPMMQGGAMMGMMGGSGAPADMGVRMHNMEQRMDMMQMMMQRMQGAGVPPMPMSR